MGQAYKGRTQTQAKHFILRNYLQKLTYVLFEGNHSSLAYVDGFSGPWESRTEDFSDTSFMIALEILQAIHRDYKAKGRPKTTKCFFVEENPSTFAKLKLAVQKYHDPQNNFYVSTFNGKFEDAIPHILSFIKGSFALTFIDPTGWKGYPYDKIAPILRHERGEVLINFMYDFINRFASVDDPKIEASLAPILGGPGWRSRLDTHLPRGRAVEKLFRETLKREGLFRYVLSTCIEKTTSDRPHFFIAYGTRNARGVEEFRNVEQKALATYQANRIQEKLTREQDRTGQYSFLGTIEPLNNSAYGELVKQNYQLAQQWIIDELERKKEPLVFRDMCVVVLEQFMVRATDVKNICVELAEKGVIEASWKLGTTKRHKPREGDLIVRKVS